MKSRAFTLIEMLIAVVIFSIVIGTATGVFVSAIKLQKYNLTYQRLLDQTSYAMEYMSRAIRMAKRNDAGICVGMDAASNYEPHVVGIADDEIKFATYHGQCWKFFLEEDLAGFNRLKIEQVKQGVFSEYYLTSDDFDVKSFNVVVLGDGADQKQPRVTIFMEIVGIGRAPQPKIQIQTTISQRDLDVLQP